ncbi:MAG TPA: cysteine--tRNA ligase [Longimicrobiales bacterium]
MALRFYNTLTRSLEEFEPLEPGTARMYACGPTVYQLPHIGNYRTFLFNDLLHRYLEWKGLDVKFVMNLTDVDDKTIDGALRQGVSLEEFTEPVIRGFFDDLDALGVRRADVYPRATRHVDAMVELIGRLVERGHAYAAADGSVYYDVTSFPGYGRLSRVDLSAMRRGERVAADEYEKGDIRDFALWKAAKDVDRQVGAAWETPWGTGRPGWHIECSAMSMAELGETFDIHTGGEDLVFPHHEDEIAQSEGATGKPFARFWLHVKHLLVNGEKMSKSKGNVFSLHDLVERGHSAAAVRYLLLSAHYRHELNFTFDGLDHAHAALRRILDFDDRLANAPVAEDAPGSALPELAAAALRGFEDALDDDLDTPGALATLFNFIRESNAALDRSAAVQPAELQAARHAIARIDDVLGVLPLARAASRVDQELADWVERKLAERQAARAKRDFATADRIRDELARAGITIEDTPHGPRWKLAP